MRATLTALLAFAAGVLATLAVHDRLPQAPWDTLAPAVQPAAPATVAAPLEDPEASAAAWNDWPLQAPTPEQVLYAQPRLMKTALAKLGPRVPDRPNLYLLAFAGDGSEDVFGNEAEYAAHLFTRRFGPATHALVLENNPATLTTRPLASWSNLEIALDGLAEAMRPDDILMLYLTTHGSEDHQLLVDMDPLPLDPIDAIDLPGILAEHRFPWKVVVVNACYSGGFIPPLRGPGTLVLTAARSDRSSFGCGSESDITYFGHAWLVDALNRTADLVEAFRQAKHEIAQWERRDLLTPSEPQIHVGQGIEAQLARWRKGVEPGPAVPFTPAASASAASPRRH